MAVFAMLGIEAAAHHGHSNSGAQEYVRDQHHDHHEEDAELN